MSENRMTDLVVSAYGINPVEISNGIRISKNKRATVKASVDTETGEVTFYIDKKDIEKLEE